MTVKPPNKKCRNGLIMPQTAVYRSLRDVPALCKIGFPAYSILFHHLILTVLPKAAITKLKFLKEMHTLTKISEDSETVFYIFFLIYNKVKCKQLPKSNCLHSVSHFNSLPQLLTKSRIKLCFKTDTAVSKIT